MSWTENEQKSREGHGDIAERECQEWGEPTGEDEDQSNRKGGEAAIFKGSWDPETPSEESSLRNLGFRWAASGHETVDFCSVAAIYQPEAVVM